MDDDGWCAPRSAAKVQKVPSRRGSCSSARPQRVSHAFSKWGGFTLTFADMCGYFNGKKIIINQDTVNHGNLMDFGGFPMILKRKPTPGEALISRQPHVTALGAQPNHSWVAARSSRPDSIILDLEISGTAYHLDFFFVVNLSLRDQIAKVQNEYVLGTNGVSFHIFRLSANPYPTPTGVLCHVQQQVQQRKARHHELHAHGTTVAAHHGCGDLGTWDGGCLEDHPSSKLTVNERVISYNML